MTFLFWNIAKRDLWSTLDRLCNFHNVDLVVLAESPSGATSSAKQLTQIGTRSWHSHFRVPTRTQVLSCTSRATIEPVYDERAGMLSIHRVVLENTDFLLATTHLPSQRYWEEGELAQESNRMSSAVRQSEIEYGHERTVVVGDFNMDPYAPGMVSSHGFHALMTRQLAGKRSRIVAGTDYSVFYNPMWGFFGDRTPGPAGSYFYRRSTPTTYFWHIFDQVLIRPDLLSVFSEVQIIDHDGTQSLIDEHGYPDNAVASDHLPLLFRLDL